MGLAVGTQLGPYEIVSPAGAGGMGEVYRARDTRLDRIVAVKILPKHLAEKLDATERFDREARAISALSHPHICQLYDVGAQNGIRYIVMEFLEGETLADRLRRGPLPLEQVLRYGAEIADGLEQAHRTGVVHRDLKPGNVMLTRSGAKLMDFGLAKPTMPDRPPSSSLTRTITSPGHPLTAEGTVVGTYQYMSPEQVEGKEADVRSDIFSLGAVLYEMVTAKRAFEGKTAASTIAAILAAQPEPISSRQPMTPPALDYAVRTCLAKDPDERFQTAHDLKLQLRWLSQSSQGAVPPIGRPALRRLPWLIAGLVALLVVAGFLGWWLDHPAPNGATVTADLGPPPGSQFTFLGDFAGPPAVSPDGAHLAFCASNGAGARSLWIRNLATGAAQQLSGTNSATFPFWSPDSGAVGFFADGKLKTIRLATSEVKVLADALVGRGGAWGTTGTIVFAPDTRTGIFKISAAGGAAQAITKPDPARHTTHRWPFFLPDGKHFLFLAVSHESPRGESSGIYAGSIEGGEARFLVHSLGNPLYISGALLFMQDANLMAQPFDLGRFALTGDAHVAAQSVIFDLSTWHALFSGSQNGVLVYQTGNVQGGDVLNWYGRAGKMLGTARERALHQTFRLSPDGKRLAVSEGASSNIFVHDLAHGSSMRLTFGLGEGDTAPVWSPDGQWIAYGKHQSGGNYNVYRKRADGSGAEELLTSAKRDRIPYSWSPDGRYLLFSEGTLGAGDISALPLAGDRKPIAIVNTGTDTFNAQFSPDGRLVAYSSVQGGDQQVYVTTFPDHGSTWQVTTKGCSEPRWNSNGRELFCLSPDNHLMSIQVNGRGSTFQVGEIRSLFAAPLHTSTFNMWSYDVSADGQRFLFSADSAAADAIPLTIVSNWTPPTEK